MNKSKYIDIDNKTLAWLKSLKDKKEKQRYQNFVVEANKLSLELLTKHPNLIHGIYATSSWLIDHEQLLESLNKPIYCLKQKDIDRVSVLKDPPEVICTAHFPNFEENTEQNGSVFYLDKIQDPGNLGTIIRSAEWFGIKTIYASLDSVDCFNVKCIQASMGSIFRTRVEYVTIDSLLEKFPNAQVIGMDMDGQSIGSLEISSYKNSIWALGSEGQGLSKEVRKKITKYIQIPPATSNMAESLNIATTSSILFFYLNSKNII
jgi:TrmH family RNA methyltransferase